MITTVIGNSTASTVLLNCSIQTFKPEWLIIKPQLCGIASKCKGINEGSNQEVL